MARVNVYVDGYNLYYGCLKDTPYRWLDLAALCGRLLPKDQINRIRYFTAIVEARASDPQQPLRQQVYIRALETIPNLSVHYGTFRTRPTRLLLVKPPRLGSKFAHVWKTEEKGSDVNLATYLLLDAFEKDCEVGVIVSNDADLKEPVEIAQRQLGIKVGVINPHPAKRRSRDLKPTFFKQIRRSVLPRCQFPPILKDARGEIRKPASWS